MCVNFTYRLLFVKIIYRFLFVNITYRLLFVSIIHGLLLPTDSYFVDKLSTPTIDTNFFYEKFISILPTNLYSYIPI